MSRHGGRASAHFLAVLGEGINQDSSSEQRGSPPKRGTSRERRDVAQPEHMVVELKSVTASAI